MRLPVIEGLAEIWEFDRDLAVELIVRTALSRAEQPTMKARLIRSTGDTLTVELVGGTITDATATLCVGG